MYGLRPSDLMQLVHFLQSGHWGKPSVIGWMIGKAGVSAGEAYRAFSQLVKNGDIEEQHELRYLPDGQTSFNHRWFRIVNLDLGMR